LIAFGHPCPVSDLFGHAGRDLLDRLQIPDPWRANIDVSLALIDDLELRIAELTVRLKRQGAEHRYIPVLVTAPGIGWINAYTIASEIGDIGRFASPAKLCGYTGLCPRVNQSGASDRRGPISKHGPKYLRWALFEAAMNACKHPYYAERYQRTKRRLGRQRGPKVAQIELARKLTEAIWPHAHPQPALRSGRCPFSSSRLTAHFGHAPPDEPLRFSQVPASDGAIAT
jgi:transposase